MFDLDVASEGETIEEAKMNLNEAVTLYLETTIESNLPVIQPVSDEENPLILREKDVVEKFLLIVDLHVSIYV